MNHKSLVKACVTCIAVSAALAQGCSHSMSSSSTRIRQATWQADLDDCRVVSLSFDRVSDRTEGKPVRKYEQLTLKVRPKHHLRFESRLKSIELKPGVRRGQFKFDDVDVRTDEGRQRVWFVDRGAGRVIATLDRLTGTTTGPDDAHPRWATPDGGILLEPCE